MTEDEMRRKMEFIVEHQAAFAAGMQQMQERQDQFEEKQNRLVDSLLTVVGIVGKLTAAQERTDAKIANLAEAQARTEERLNALIIIVERYFNNGRDGKSEA